MISELISLIIGDPLRLIHADNVKFLTLMVPVSGHSIDAELHLRTEVDGRISANATLQDGETVFIKFKGIFGKEE
jgi:hypothetical protein